MPAGHAKGLSPPPRIKLCFSKVQTVAYIFGSVPLKTYLPDGDIDIAVFQRHGSTSKDTWTARLLHFLEKEQKRRTDFEIKDAQVINAEVEKGMPFVGPPMSGPNNMRPSGLIHASLLPIAGEITQVPHKQHSGRYLIQYSWWAVYSRLPRTGRSENWQGSFLQEEHHSGEHLLPAAMACIQHWPAWR